MMDGQDSPVSGAAGPVADDSRLPRRCLKCSYILEGLVSERCPECGRPFDFADATSFARKPPFIFWRLWAPGLALAVACGTVTFTLLLLMGSLGWGLVIATPVAVGALIGYRCRVGPAVRILLVCCAIISMIATLLSASLAGLLCGLIALAIIALPCVLGAQLGWLLRRYLKRRESFDQRWYLPVIALFGPTLLLGIAERSIGWTHPVVTVRTQRCLPLSTEQAWRRLAFYEDLPGPSPGILRLAGPKPVRTVIEKTPSGEVHKCVYERGHLCKRMTEVAPLSRFAFEVTEQHVGEEHSVRILGGSFEFEAVDAGHTLVTLSTTYEARLRPRFCWRPFEAYVVHCVHTHVLNGMEQAGDRETLTQLAESMPP